MDRAKFKPITRLHTAGDSQSRSYHHQLKLSSLNIFQLILHIKYVYGKSLAEIWNQFHNVTTRVRAAIMIYDELLDFFFPVSGLLNVSNQDSRRNNS